MVYADDDDHGKKNTVGRNALRLVNSGQKIFRFDTFGDQAFWGDTLKLHQAEGSRFGGVGTDLSPRAAIAAGLKVDIDALPNDVVAQLNRGAVNLDDPAVTLMLLKATAVVGVTGFFNSAGSLKPRTIRRSTYLLS